MSGDVKHKGDEFSKIIHDEYDKLLAIIDYYHHIHEKDIP